MPETPDAATAPGDRRPHCDHGCLLDDSHVERGESHFYGYDHPTDNGPMLSEDEREALSLTAQLAQACMKVIGKGPSAEHDWAEMAHRIHDIQHALMSNAAARAYPDTFRLLGGTLARVDAVGQP